MNAAEDLRALLDQRQGRANRASVAGLTNHVLGGGREAPALIGQVLHELGQGSRWLLGRQIEESVRQLIRGHIDIDPLTRSETYLPSNLGFFALEATLQVCHCCAVEQGTDAATDSFC